jgi:lipoprotein-anchoring transpeptidase ErfK/SrfK
MTRITLLTVLSAAVVASATSAAARDRYAERPPVVVSPDLAAPWVLQLRRTPAGASRQPAAPTDPLSGYTLRIAPEPPLRRKHAAGKPTRSEVAQTAAVRMPDPRQERNQLDPKYLPQTVDYDGPHAPGTIVIDTREHFLYLIEPGGKARRYGVGTGKPGFEWAGTHRVTMKREWPDWRPPAAMIARERKKGRILPVHMAGGPDNPLGARALYLGSTLYRIHGTNQPWTIGKAVSSGCIRMRNEDVIELYERVGIGTKVIVI